MHFYTIFLLYLTKFKMILSIVKCHLLPAFCDFLRIEKRHFQHKLVHESNQYAGNVSKCKMAFVLFYRCLLFKSILRLDYPFKESLYRPLYQQTNGLVQRSTPHLIQN